MERHSTASYRRTGCRFATSASIGSKIRTQDVVTRSLKDSYWTVVFLFSQRRNLWLPHNLHIFGFPLVPLAPLSSLVTSVSEVSAFKLTGSPRADGLLFNFSSAFCFRVFCPPSDLAPVSSGVGFVSEVSARRDTGSPSWDGFLEFFSRAIDARDLLS